MILPSTQKPSFKQRFKTTSLMAAIIVVGTFSSCGTDSADKDDDGDGVKNSQDAFPKDKLEWLDTDNDGTGDNTDLDDDNDGISDLIEIELEFDPLDSTNTPLDTDADGIPDVQDLDDDNDGYVDTLEVSEMTDPLDAQSIPLDTDGDFDPNSTDEDDDNDGMQIA
ncbi:hypothetical protein [Marinicellulosiphila megalodicopiae]|uniref:hypothetical protein n=1 Tax=Marinicellulosiphila megalodicopiae TaxID=2724896 RepID=UPI003BB0475B